MNATVLICYVFVWSCIRYELAQSELQKGKYMLAEEDLSREHSLVREQKLEDFEKRKKKDDKYVQG